MTTTEPKYKRDAIVWWCVSYYDGPTWRAGRVIRCGPRATRVLTGPYVLENGGLAGSSEQSIPTKDLWADSPDVRACADLAARRKAVHYAMRNQPTHDWSPERLDALERVLDNTKWEPAR